MERRAEFTARNIANTLWSLAKINHHPGSYCPPLYVLPHVCVQATMRHCGRWCAACSVVRQPKPPWSLPVSLPCTDTTLWCTAGEPFLQSMAQEVKEKAADGNAQNVSS